MLLGKVLMLGTGLVVAGVAGKEKELGITVVLGKLDTPVAVVDTPLGMVVQVVGMALGNM